jgi:hypothetical protein
MVVSAVPQIFPVSAFAHAVRVGDSGLMAIFTAYFDASGSLGDKNVRVFTVAGFIAKQERWAAFEREWRLVRDNLGLAGCLHMKEFNFSRGAFESWPPDDPRRPKLIDALTDLIGKYSEKEFDVSLLLDDYRAADMMFALHEFANPYALVASIAVSRVSKWMKDNQPGDSVLFVFEKGDIRQDELRKLLRAESGPEPIFTPKEWTENGVRMECSPLQACDFIAYEHAKALTDTIYKDKRKLRRSMLSLAKKTDYGQYTGLGFEFLIRVCQTFNLPMRPHVP